MLGTPALFATAYGNVGSSIYYALGLTAVYALGLTPLVFVVAGVIFAATAATYADHVNKTLGVVMPSVLGSAFSGQSLAELGDMKGAEAALDEAERAAVTFDHRWIQSSADWAVSWDRRSTLSFSAAALASRPGSPARASSPPGSFRRAASGRPCRDNQQGRRQRNGSVDFRGKLFPCRGMTLPSPRHYGRGCWPAGCGSTSTDELSALSASDAGGRRCHDSGATDPRSVDYLLIS